MAEPHWLERLKERWHLQSMIQVIVVLVVFACTGITIWVIKKPILEFLAGEEGKTTLASVLYYIFILPLYNIILLGYGFLFGQLNFFWEFEKRTARKIASFLRRK